MKIPPMSVWTVDGAHRHHMIIINVTVIVRFNSKGRVTVQLLLLVALLH